MSESRPSGLLVVNADDLGLGREETDAIRASFSAGAISSATAMVWMRDSDRAAELTRDTPLPVGLHLNLIEPYDAPDVPSPVVEAQGRVIAHLRSRRGRSYLYHPDWAQDFDRCIGDQVARFEEIYGRLPTHFDGHQHMHLVPNALFSKALTPLGRCRRAVNRPQHEGRPYKHAARTALSGLARLRFTTTRWCLSIRALDPDLGGAGLEEGLGRAAMESVEVMVHPGWPDERQVLLDWRWRERIERFRLGSFAHLPGRGMRRSW